MTSARGGGEAASRAETGKSLKDQYRWQLWIIVAVNTLFLYGVAHANAINVDGLRAIFTDAQNLLPVGKRTGMTSSNGQSRLRETLYRKRRAATAIRTEPGANFFSSVR